MASPAVVAAFLARLEANWDKTPITDANAGGRVPLRNTPFLSIEFPIATEEQITIGSPGSNLWREQGIFRAVLSIPAGHTLSPYDTWLGDLRAAFRAKSFDGVETWGAAPSTTNGRSAPGAYYELSFSVPYRFDFLG